MLVSVLPIIIEVVRAKLGERKAGPAAAAEGTSDLTQPIAPVPGTPRGTAWDGPDAPAPGGPAPRAGPDDVDSTAATTRMAPVPPQQPNGRPANGEMRGPVETRSSGRPVMGQPQGRRRPEDGATARATRPRRGPRACGPTRASRHPRRPRR